jgi:N-hydroxyarylamine O-acetyltransferase
MNAKDHEYLSRIGLGPDEVGPSIGSLRLLQRRHLLSVPFENLDIHWKRPIIVDTSMFYSKIVEGGRGGFCYELNGLFNELLRAVGFETRLVSARVHTGDGQFGPEYDHAAIIVTIDRQEYLSDVGFGDFTAEPLRFELDAEQLDREGTFVIRRSSEEGYFEVAKKVGVTWQPEYILKPDERSLDEFIEMCDFQQYSPESHFTKGKVCSLMTPEGRKTLSDKKFIVTVDGEKMETPVESVEDFERILILEFGIPRPPAIGSPNLARVSIP